MSSKVPVKKGVSKDDLKRLMKKMKTEGAINHPLAKYNSLGHLICTVCNCQIKSDRLWAPHLLSRSHKENVSKPSSRAEDLKRDLDNKRKLEAESQSAKRLKEESKPQKPKGILKNAIPLAGYSSSDESDHEEITSAISIKQDRLSHNKDDNGAGPSGLPTDFFDAAVSDTELKKEEETPNNASEQLPEGFFDDPKADAKARKVEYIDKDEAEWDKFQSEMKQQSEISEIIKAEDDTEITEQRQRTEIDEQLAQWGMVNNIIQKKEELMKGKQKTSVQSTENDSSSDVDDPDLEQMMDWRTKKVIK